MVSQEWLIRYHYSQSKSCMGKRLQLTLWGPLTMLQWTVAVLSIDYFSKLPEVAFVSQVTSATVIKFLFVVCNRERNPKELISKNAVQFTSLEFGAFLTERNIIHRRSALYYPRANREIGHFYWSLKESLQTAKSEGKAWRTFTVDFQHVYRATQHATTQKTPAELLYGRELLQVL